MPARVLVIGSSGFLGSHIFSGLKATAWGIDIVDNRGDARFTRVSPNLQELDSLIGTLKPHVCINASGSASVSRSFQSPEIDRELNVRNVEIILESLKRCAHECRFINISSASVYGTPDTLPITEDAALNAVPLSPYGRNKRESELLLDLYAREFGMQTLSVRIFSCFGVGQRKLLFWDIFEKIRASESGELILFGSGMESRDFIDVRDVVRAMEILISNAQFDGSAINLATGIETTIRDAVTMAIESLDLKDKVRMAFTGQERIGDPKNWRADISKLNEIGFQPTILLRDGLKDYYNWARSL